MSGAQTTDPVVVDPKAAPVVVDPKTVLEAPGDDGKGQPAGSAWREDWRDAMATRDGKVDDKLRKTLDRYADPGAVATAYTSLRTRMDSGEFKQALPADAKPEEVTEWRKANGVPEKPEDYLKNLPAGLVIGEGDKPLLTEFLAGIHAVNAPPAVAHAALQAYFKIEEKVSAERAEADSAYGHATEDALRAEWGSEYRGNINAAKALIETMAPKGTIDKIMNARMDGGAGRPMASDPDVIKFLALIAREVNPAATIVPGTGASAGKGITERIGEIEVMMKDRRGDYWRGPKSEGIQAEYRQLLEAKEKMAARA